jgi:rhamnopyranosyl-N-acetylglucosaminyl-diphospho-decaprenol beta-1,3/1,4-galactofuranosyltransferase
MKSTPSVAAVVLTYDRKELLRSCLDGLSRQVRPPDEVVVVDNGSADGTMEFLESSYPQVTRLRIEDNAGYGNGLSHGMRYAHDRGHDWIWTFDDDDRPEPEALDRLLEVARRRPDSRTGIIGSWGYSAEGRVLREGKVWRNGRWKHLVPDTENPYSVDAMALSGTLISRELTATVGFPKDDYYLMFEDVEYCLRAVRAGFDVIVVPQPLTVMLRSGAGSANKSYPPWRGYYQTRNHLAMALEHRSAPEVFWWGVRQAKLCAGTLLWLDRKPTRIGLRLRGAWDAALGVKGKSPYAHLHGSHRPTPAPPEEARTP